MDGVSRRKPGLRLRCALSLACAQLRPTGLVALAIPLGAGLVVGVGGLLAAQLAGASLATVVMMLFVQIYPVSVGACAVIALSDDPLVELQESTPAGFRAVQLARLALVVAGGVLGALALFAPLHAAGVFPNDVGLLSLLTPAGGAVIIALVAYAAVSFTGSARTATMAVIAVLVFMTLFWDLQVPDPLAQRQGPLLVACAAAAAAWFASRGSERMVGKARGAR